MPKKFEKKPSNQLRLPTEEFEIFVYVESILGNGMFYARTMDGKKLLGHIRGKHRGRYKRDNMVTKGAIILVGLRSYEKPNFKECDLLNVYSSNEIHLLSEQFNLKGFLQGTALSTATEQDDGVLFKEEDDEDETKTETETETETETKPNATSSYLGSNIDWNDI